MRINDISVSRCHAIIKYKEGSFVIEDNQSKFGTIVLLKEKLEISPGEQVAVQYGRTVFCVSAREIEE